MSTELKSKRLGLLLNIVLVVILLAATAQLVAVVPAGPWDPAPVQASPPVGTVPVYRFWSPSLGDHFYTASEDERDWLLEEWWGVYQYEGVAFYAWPGE